MTVSKGSLLIVDDNEMNRDMLSRRLQRKGFFTKVAEHGRQALEMIAVESFDVILLDIMMPEINGIEILKILRKDYTMAELPVIMVSAKDQSKDIVEALNLGANDYVTKPIDFPVALARIHTQLHRKRAEEALLLSEAKNRAILNAVPDVLFRVGADCHFLDLKGAEKIGLTEKPSELVGQPLSAALPPSIETLLTHTIQQVSATESSEQVEFELARNGNFMDYEARVVPGRENDFLILMRDITERKHMEQMRNEFISILTHDMRTSLTSIRGSLGLISKGTAGDIPLHVKTLVDIAHKNSERLVRLINDILDIDRMESGKMSLQRRQLPILQLLKQAVEACQATYGIQYKVQFALHMQEGMDDVNVLADEDRLFQVVTKLLFNAAKFSPSDETVDIVASLDAERVRVAITDHGPSIPEAFRSRIFQKFAQADTSNTRQQGDTGLGLSISKAIIEQLGGQIGFFPGEEGGNTFFFEMPVGTHPSSSK